MNWIDLKLTPKKAFANGFWKGMAAPLMLFSTSHGLPPQAQPGEFKPLPRRSSEPMQDWVKVGETLISAAKTEREKNRVSGG